MNSSYLLSFRFMPWQEVSILLITSTYEWQLICSCKRGIKFLFHISRRQFSGSVMTNSYLMMSLISASSVTPQWFKIKSSNNSGNTSSSKKERKVVEFKRSRKHGLTKEVRYDGLFILVQSNVHHALHLDTIDWNLNDFFHLDAPKNRKYSPIVEPVYITGPKFVLFFDNHSEQHDLNCHGSFPLKRRKRSTKIERGAVYNVFDQILHSIFFKSSSRISAAEVINKINIVLNNYTIVTAKFYINENICARKLISVESWKRHSINILRNAFCVYLSFIEINKI